MKKNLNIKPLILLELNEINFDIVNTYVSIHPNLFPGFKKLLASKKIQTHSENIYNNIEPWIQWVSVHTGKSFDEHGIFRLGDIVGSKESQIFEELEMAGFSVGSILSMNTENRLKKPAYFIPDPWTQTPSDDSFWSRYISSSLTQVINDNAQSKITMSSAVIILLGLIRFAKFKHFLLYFKLAYKSFRKPWRKALLLDLFLHDIHTSFFRDKKPHFSTLFLNCGAHIQHHYFHNSPYISTKKNIKNPDWYISNKLDPFYEMLEIYDYIISEYLSDNNIELIVATGLSQIPYDQIKYYYRLKNHASFLKKIGVNFLKIYPRMTRDFLITFESTHSAMEAQIILGGLRIEGKSEPMFGQIDNRNDQLFVTLTYPLEIKNSDIIKFGPNKLEIYKEVAFVAIKNGMHQSKGFVFFTDFIAKFCPTDGSHVKNIYFSIHKYFNNHKNIFVY